MTKKKQNKLATDKIPVHLTFNQIQQIMGMLTDIPTPTSSSTAIVHGLQVSFETALKKHNDPDKNKHKHSVARGGKPKTKKKSNAKKKTAAKAAATKPK